MECDISVRSARGYCPGEEGHQDEIDFAEEVTATVETTTTVATVTVEQPITELPYTGPVDPILPVIATLSLIVGAVLVRLGRADR